MLKNTKKIAIAAMLSLASLASLPATAEAGHRHHGGGGGVGIEFHFGDSSHTNWRRDRHWRHGSYDRRCSPRRAVHKASRMGVRHAHVRYVNRHVINVKGRSHGHRVSILFARAPGCPVIRY